MHLPTSHKAQGLALELCCTLQCLLKAHVNGTDQTGLSLCWLQATAADLNTMCSSLDAAQNRTTKLGQAITAAIPASFGPNPCTLFKGKFNSLPSMPLSNNFNKQRSYDDATCSSTMCVILQVDSSAHAGANGNLYNNLSTMVCDPRLEVNLILTGIANKSDCKDAIMQLRSRNAVNCSTTLTANSPQSTYSQSAGTGTPLATAGTCQVVLDAGDGQTLSCVQIADYAANLATACSNSQLGTGGRVYPLPYSGSGLETAVVLSAVI